ncbi:type II toxin-antitoxin system PemK/MazF family toxin [Deferribacter abyssi]|uniref:type II toxin-antitoxin system PemK/MazF family toxin n=1 Tax=Deferribacter abyssi TaxID=213806 RepID=UPI003C1F5F32
MIDIKRGYVYLVNLNPTKGAEINKIRPAVIVSNDINNQYADTVTIVPITSGNVQKIYPFEVKIPKGIANLDKDSKAKANQIRTIDKSRIVKEIGKLPDDITKKIEYAISVHLDLNIG